jgi:hypothetical protein
MPSPSERVKMEECSQDKLYLNAYVVTRIVYEIIKMYMLANPPEKCGITLAQKYSADYKKSGILLDVAYNWRTSDMSKVPAVFIQREDVNIKTPTLGQEYHSNVQLGSETRFAFNNMPVTITCVAAEPVAVVENLAEYVKQPLMYFRKEIQKDFGIRQFKLETVTKPKPLSEGKNNFYVELKLDITFDDGWIVSKDALKIRRIGLDLYDNLSVSLNTILV